MNNNITAIILVALAIGTYLTFTRAKLAEVNEVRVVNTQYLSAIDSADRLIKVRDAVLKDYNALSSEDRDRLDKMLPNTVDNIRLIIDLNSVALRHGFSLRDIKAAASNANQGGLPASQGFGSEIGDAGASIPTPTLLITFKLEYLFTSKERVSSMTPSIKSFNSGSFAYSVQGVSKKHSISSGLRNSRFLAIRIIALNLSVV